MIREENRVLIADGDNNLANRMAAYLRESGFKPKVITNSYLLQKTLLEWRPHFLFIDLLYPGYYALKALKFLKQRDLLGEGGIQVIVMSKHNAELNVRNCLEAGAKDFMVKPIKLIDILQRLALLSQVKKYNFKSIVNQDEQQTRNYFKMIKLLSEVSTQDKDLHTMRFELIQMVSLALKAVRTSVFITDAERTGIRVIASSDDRSLRNLPLKLPKYPEIQYVLRTEKSIFIESLEKDQTMSFVKHEVKSIAFDSMMVLPLICDGDLKGCVSVRMPKDCKVLGFFDMKIAEIATQLIAMTWKFEEAKLAEKAA